MTLQDLETYRIVSLYIHNRTANLCGPEYRINHITPGIKTTTIRYQHGRYLWIKRISIPNEILIDEAVDLVKYTEEQKNKD